MVYNEQQTRLVKYLGISLTDLAEDQEPIIDVLIPSLSPGALGGPVAPGTTTGTVSFLDENGVKRTANITSANHVKAEWFNENRNAYAPLVKKKEQVRVFQNGNGDKYYWEATGRDSNLRTLDRHRNEVSATPITGAAKTDDNTYFSEVDAVNGLARFHTSKANKEPFAYEVKIDTKNGNIRIVDDKEGDHGFNKIFIDSNKNIIHISNNSGTSFHMEGENLSIDVPGNFILKAGKQLYLESPIYTFNKEQRGVWRANVTNVAFQSTSFTLAATTVGVAGAVKVAGPLVTNGIRSPSFVEGDVGSAYIAATTDPNSGSAVANSNASDTDIAGAGNRHAAAWEDVKASIDSLCGELQKVAAKAGASVNVNTAKSKVDDSKMDMLKGK